MLKATPVPAGWRLARFDSFLQRIERNVTLEDATQYQTVGVRWYGAGAFVRETLLGMNIARKQQWIIRAGDVVYNKLFAWKGAFAIAHAAVDGYIVSDKFPTYKIDTSQVDPRYLAYYFLTTFTARQAEALSKGAAAISKLTINPPQFWELTMPLHCLPEQRRIVARIEALGAMIAEVRGLRQNASAETDALMRSIGSKVLSSLPTSGTLGDILSDKPRNGWSARCDNAENGIPVLSLGAITGFSYQPSAFKRTSEPTVPSAHYWLRRGDLLISRSNTPELVGHAAIYNGSPSPCIYPDLMMRLVVDGNRADIGFVHRWLQTNVVRDYIRRNAKGTSPTMKKINHGTVMNIPFPVGLSLCAQRRIISTLESLQVKVDALKQLQAETAAELDALLPSVLDKAFRGHL